jgi:hypothetical protein
MLSFKPLLIFAAWVAPDKPDTAIWRNYYLSLLSDRFGSIDKVVSVNPGCDPTFAAALENIPNVVALEHVAPENNSRSDAAGYQLGLWNAQLRLPGYDVAMFGHCKGSSHAFKDFEFIANDQIDGCLNIDRIEEAFRINRNAIYARNASMPNTMVHIKQFHRLLDMCGISGPQVCFTVPYTMFSVSAAFLSSALQQMPEELITSSLHSLGFNRYFFEFLFPSLLVAAGADLSILDSPRAIDATWPDVTYDVLPRHNSALVLREMGRKKVAGETYVQQPIPCVFGSNDAIQSVRVKFSLA